MRMVKRYCWPLVRRPQCRVWRLAAVEPLIATRAPWQHEVTAPSYVNAKHLEAKKDQQGCAHLADGCC